MPIDIPPAPALGGSRTLAEREAEAFIAAGQPVPDDVMAALPRGSDLGPPPNETDDSGAGE